jgi:hypothetical protein
VISAAKVEAILRVEWHSRNFGLNRSKQLHKAEHAPATSRAIYNRLGCSRLHSDSIDATLG